MPDKSFDLLDAPHLPQRPGNLAEHFDVGWIGPQRILGDQQQFAPRLRQICKFNEISRVDAARDDVGLRA
jgi:hypothetical protein